ncbi:hypothetical protein AgCh_038864 [Apium graveolens]
MSYLKNVEENKKKFLELRLGNYAANPIKLILQQSTKEKNDGEQSSEYVVENESGDESDDTSENQICPETESFTGPRTRSRANARNLGDKDLMDAIGKGKKVATSTEKEASGAAITFAAYVALRERQKQNLKDELGREDVGDTILQRASEAEEVEAGPKKYRGHSKMLKVHGRSAGEKKFVKLSKRGQPIGDRKTRSELSNFLGTLVKDYVLLTYVNWHVVPDDLKKQMLEYTLVNSITNLTFNLLFSYLCIN